jgi:hypothetical protein
MRSREVWILKVENLVLKKKREYEREEEEGGVPMRVYRHKGASIGGAL